MRLARDSGRLQPAQLDAMDVMDAGVYVSKWEARVPKHAKVTLWGPLQAKEMIDLLPRDELPTVVAGDFNANWDASFTSLEQE